jgi:acetylglutamate kinase
MQPIVIKIGGHELNDDLFLMELADVVASLTQPVVIVHGGGKDITHIQELFGIETQFIDGIRVTDKESLMIAEMVLCGLVNKRIVRFMLTYGVDALGMSGVDRGIVHAHKMSHSTDMMYTGEIDDVRGEPILQLLGLGITPIIAPISLGDENNFNVNADHVAGAIAKAIGAERLIFITNIEGVLDLKHRFIPMLTPQMVAEHIQHGVIRGGMIPKVTTAIEAIQGGVAKTVITNLSSLKTHGGTVFLLEENKT